MSVVSHLQKIAVDLEEKGRAEEAGAVTVLAEEISLMDKDAQEMIAAEEMFIKMALDEYAEANRQIEAAAKKKKKWVQAIGLKKGRFTEYCKKQGFKGPCQECAEKALKSPNGSVRGMAGFYKATQKFKKKK